MECCSITSTSWNRRCQTMMPRRRSANEIGVLSERGPEPLRLFKWYGSTTLPEIVTGAANGFS
jgi:hypothetical protein